MEIVNIIVLIKILWRLGSSSWYLQNAWASSPCWRILSPPSSIYPKDQLCLSSHFANTPTASTVPAQTKPPPFSSGGQFDLFLSPIIFDSYSNLRFKLFIGRGVWRECLLFFKECPVLGEGIYFPGQFYRIPFGVFFIFVVERRLFPTALSDGISHCCACWVLLGGFAFVVSFSLVPFGVPRFRILSECWFWGHSRIDAVFSRKSGSLRI